MDQKLKIDKYFFVIFAAGAGKRLGKLGTKYPKSLLKINNKEILLTNLENLRSLGLKKITIVVGYNKEKIINILRNFKRIKFKFIKIKNFNKYGHGMSWFAIKKTWLKEKKPLLIMHADIIFNFKYLINIIKSNKENLIGVSSRSILKSKKRENWVVSLNKKGQIIKIDYLKNLKSHSGEILGINKISKKASYKIFKFMKNFLKGRNKTKPWEFVINKYIEKFPGQLYTLKNQSYNWININTVKDYNLAKKNFKL